MFFKEPLTEWFFVEPKMVLWRTFILKSVQLTFAYKSKIMYCKIFQFFFLVTAWILQKQMYLC